MDVEYISLHRYIRNTPSDTEVHAEYQLRADRGTRPIENNNTDPCKTQAQALRLWSVNTDSKTLDYERTNPRGYQIMRTHIKETTGIQDLASPSHQ